MKKKLVLLLFSIFNIMIFSQNNAKYAKNDISISSELGLSSIKLDNNKYNAYFTGGKLKYSFNISNKFYISTGLRNSIVRFNNSNFNYIELKYFDIPLSIGLDDFGLLKKINMINSTITINVGFRYRLLYKSSNISLNNSSNFGLLMNIEFKQKINNKTYFLLGYNMSGDLNEFKTNNILIKNLDENSINMGIGYIF